MSEFLTTAVAQLQVMNLLETRISLTAIAANTALIKKMVAPAKLMCVVKADAYNHGAVQAARVMEENGADQFGVATIDEALELRAGGITRPILCWIWSTTQENKAIAAIEAGIDLAVVSIAHARLVSELSLRIAPTRVTVKVDTGLHRSGVDEKDWEEVFTMLRDAEGVEVTGIFSHLACADEVDNPYNDLQADTFRRAIACGRKLGLDLPINHLSNSPATLTRPDLRFDMVRPGIALYGLEPVAGYDHGLQEAMSWVGKVTVVKPIRKGETTSYSRTWAAPEDGFTAVVPAGYADGLPRAAQGHLQVTIDGHHYPQVGRVCMDQFVIFLGKNEHGVAPGDEAVIFGPDGVSSTVLAEAMGTINYELVCRPTGRTRRVVIGA